MNDNNTFNNQPSNMNSYNQPTQNNTINNQPSNMNSYNQPMQNSATNNQPNNMSSYSQPTQNNTVNSQSSNMNLDQLLKNNSNNNVNKIEPKPVSPNNSGKKSKMPIVLLIIILVIGLIVGAIFLLPKDDKDGDKDTQLTEPPKDYISINTIEDYEKLMNGTYDLTKNYILMSDLDLKDYCKQNICKPIGMDNKDGFTGVFDGNNHTISNYYYETTNSSKNGFFAQIKQATIKNLKLENSMIKIKNVDSICGAGLLVGITYNSIIENSSVTGTIENDATFNGNIESIGLLIGEIATETYNTVSLGLDPFKVNDNTFHEVVVKVDDCHASGKINLKSNKSITNVGGLIGETEIGYVSQYSYGAMADIKNVTSDVEINIDSLEHTEDNFMYYARNVGGLIGSIRGTYVSKSGSLGNINAKHAVSTGGLIGTVNWSMIKECYAKGDITASYYAAGFISDFNNDIGGIKGWSGVENSYSTGDVIIDGTNSNMFTNGIYKYCKCAAFVYSLHDGIYNSYSSGNIIYKDSTISEGKPFIADEQWGETKNVYYNGDYINYVYYDSSLIKLNTASMLNRSSYKEFDFENIWSIDEGVSTPYFKWEK